ncbi:hypothetical protein HNY73_015809 [Argiope bruennichi]|uniref:Uncharacterized protein n=1 Tax=Argiope bruennichi TaxID=94029 RepID=A0A8T0EKT1_ARGBR|nr:hypothetical protein HNY73_015809 [Argiope bruennichi]
MMTFHHFLFIFRNLGTARGGGMANQKQDAAGMTRATGGFLCLRLEHYLGDEEARYLGDSWNENQGR